MKNLSDLKWEIASGDDLVLLALWFTYFLLCLYFMGLNHHFCRIAIIVVSDYDADWYGSCDYIRVAIKVDKKYLCPHAIY